MLRNLSITPLSAALGATVHGLDLSEEQSAETVAAIREALLRYEVLFFEHQDIWPELLRDFAARFGKLHLHPIRPHVPGVPEILIMQDGPGDTGRWRTDVSFIPAPPKFSMLYVRETPRSGGDTVWSSMRTAFDALSEPMQQFLSGLSAEHDFTRAFPIDRFASLNLGPDRFAWTQREHPATTHPVVRTHPETNRDGLFVNAAFTTRILGLKSAESRMLLDYLAEHVQQPEFSVQWKWKPRTLALWDNRSTQHLTVDDYRPADREAYRATVVGDRPIYRVREASRLAAAE